MKCYWCDTDLVLDPNHSEAVCPMCQPEIEASEVAEQAMDAARDERLER